MEMEIMGCQIPAFGWWNYCHDLSITQYFDSAMQAKHMKRWNPRGNGGEKGIAGGEQLDLFRSYSFQRKPPQIKVIRRQVDKHNNDSELPHDGGVQAEVGASFSSRKEVEACALKRKVVSRAVDEDLYKVPQPLYKKPKKMRKVVWSMWIGCLGLDCIV
ncbi:hypothetical protein QOZ80_6BG0485010 [Eleusine coracana subsp. coracana]|nr:hypothetical protein QOZ80_6BG0485010 [Eleusine coracana subsp. coracana]